MLIFTSRISCRIEYAYLYGKCIYHPEVLFIEKNFVYK